MKENIEMSLLDYLLIEQPNKETQVTLGKLNLKHCGNLTIRKLQGNKIQVEAPVPEKQSGVKNLVYKLTYSVDVYTVDTVTGKITKHIVDTKRVKEEVTLL